LWFISGKLRAKTNKIPRIQAVPPRWGERLMKEAYFEKCWEKTYFYRITSQYCLSFTFTPLVPLPPSFLFRLIWSFFLSPKAFVSLPYCRFSICTALITLYLHRTNLEDPFWTLKDSRFSPGPNKVLLGRPSLSSFRLTIQVAEILHS
jgi:hypothetical protein